MNRYKKINIDNIPNGLFDGYYWLSNESKPEVIIGKEIDKTIFRKMPFVIEANFYSQEKDLSIQVKNIDGEYHVAQIDVEGMTPKKYIGHDIGSDYLVVEAWGDKEDELLDGMKTKVPTWAAFKGFVKSKKIKKND